jgi:hypothetical protein
MSFLTADQKKAIRLEGSKVIELEGGIKLRTAKPSGRSALKGGELSAAVEKGQKPQSELFAFLIQSACLTESGEPLTAEDVNDLLEVLSVDAVGNLIKQLTDAFSTKPEAAPGKQ